MITENAVKTPDQRLRVFVSSTLEELAEEREAVRRAIEGLHLHPVMFELGARPHPPRTLYRAYLQQSDIFIGVYWQSYGWVGPEMEISGLEDEFLMSDQMPRLLYIKEPAPARQPGLSDLLDRIRGEGDASYKKFRDPRELGDLVANDIAILLTERFSGSVREKPDVSSAGQLPVSLTRLVGRDEELDDLCDLLTSEQIRLITITGPGGIGKTRCAIEAAALFVAASGYEVGYVPLEATRDPAQVLPHIASSLGIHPEGVPVQETLVDYLAPRRKLVVLDNLEHVLGSGPEISALLAKCPRLKVLVSSRAPLRVRGEREYQLPPLATPVEEARHAQEIAASPAVQLFCERAADVRLDFCLTAENSRAVAGICRRLDGLPLAIELAAARVRLFGPSDLLQRIEGRLDELSGGSVDVPERHRALRAAIEWSYELLDDDDRRLFRRLAIFSCGWTLQAAESVCSDPEQDVLEGLYSLAEKSLIRVDHLNGSARFGMLETVRTYASERLEESGEAPLVGSRHAEYFVAFAEEAQPHLGSHAQAEWNEKLAHDEENIRSAIKFLLKEDNIEGLARIAGSIWTYWWLHDQTSEHRGWIEAILPRTESLPLAMRARLLFAGGLGAFLAVDVARAEPLLRESAELLDSNTDASFLALTHAMLGSIEAAGHNDPKSALAHSVTASSLARQGSDMWALFYVLTSEGRLRAISGEMEAGIRLLLDSLEIALQLGNPLLIAHSRVEASWFALLAGNLELAREHLPRAAEFIRGMHHRQGLAYLLDARGVEAALMERFERAAVAFAAADFVRAAINMSLWPTISNQRQQFVERAKEALGDHEWRAAVQRGASMSTEETLEFAAS